MKQGNALVLGWSFGLGASRKQGDPGTCNMDLMRCFLNNENLRHLPLVLQEELKEAAEIQLGETALSRLHIVHVFPSPPENPPTTLSMAREGVGYARQHGYKKIYILAFPFIHRFFCFRYTKRFAKQHGIEVEVIKTGFIPFDENNGQWLARGPLRLICYLGLRACGVRWL